VSFEVGADVYGRLMNRYSEPLAVAFTDVAGIRWGQRALDVGCGPGALTAELVGRLGSEAVCAVDPSRSFVAAARERLPGVDIRLSGAERIPFPDGAFGAALALVSLFAQAGLAGAHATTITVRTSHPSFEQWWEPFTLGVGPAGEYVQSLSEPARDRLRARLRELAGGPPVEISATAWTVTCPT
jgi:SAM-dependent methyltransferase